MSMTDAALAELERRAVAGEVLAQIRFAREFANGGVRLEKERIAAIFPWLLEAAKRGDPGAQCEVGHAYRLGLGVPVDDRAAFEWYASAADRGDPSAQRWLAVSYIRGRGVEKDRTRAIRWYQAAAERGDVKSIAAFGWYLLHGKGVEQDTERGISLLLRAADDGDAFAQAELAGCHLYGVGLAKDDHIAAVWASRAADNGNAWAQQTLGFLYANGRGVARDLREAERWYERAVQSGYVGARTLLRNTRFERRFKVRPRWIVIALTVVGWIVLLHHAVTAPFRFDPLAFGLALGGVFGCIALSVIALTMLDKIAGASPRWKRWNERSDREADDVEAVHGRYHRHLLASGKLVFFVPAEDGLFALPLLHVGIAPWAAVICALLFGLAHYPKYPLGMCAFKALVYLVLVLTLLPYGIWTLIAVHLAIDAIVFALSMPTSASS